MGCLLCPECSAGYRGMNSQLFCKAFKAISIHYIEFEFLFPSVFFLRTSLVVKESTFHSKSGALGRLPQAGEGVDIQVSGQCLHESNGDCTLPFSEWGGCDPNLGEGGEEGVG